MPEMATANTTAKKRIFMMIVGLKGVLRIDEKIRRLEVECGKCTSAWSFYGSEILECGAASCLLSVPVLMILIGYWIVVVLSMRFIVEHTISTNLSRCLSPLSVLSSRLPSCQMNKAGVSSPCFIETTPKSSPIDSLSCHTETPKRIILFRPPPFI